MGAFCPQIFKVIIYSEQIKVVLKRNSQKLIRTFTEKLPLGFSLVTTTTQLLSEKQIMTNFNCALTYAQ
jgi:hypothetical protein